MPTEYYGAVFTLFTRALDIMVYFSVRIGLKTIDRIKSKARNIPATPRRAARRIAIRLPLLSLALLHSRLLVGLGEVTPFASVLRLASTAVGVRGYGNGFAPFRLGAVLGERVLY